MASTKMKKTTAKKSVAKTNQKNVVDGWLQKHKNVSWVLKKF